MSKRPHCGKEVNPTWRTYATVLKREEDGVILKFPVELVEGVLGRDVIICDSKLGFLFLASPTKFQKALKIIAQECAKRSY
jgi:hypothetical protein